MRGAIIALLVWCAAAPAWSDPAPAAAYGRLPAIADAAISPDGTKLALAQSSGDVGVVRIMQIGGGELLAVRMAERQTLRSVRFADDNTVIYTISQTFTREEAAPLFSYNSRELLEYHRAMAVSLDNRQPRLILGNRNSFLRTDMTGVVAPIEGDPGFARMVGYVLPNEETSAKGGLSGEL